jgi:hypothetical protein
VLVEKQWNESYQKGRDNVKMKANEYSSLQYRLILSLKYHTEICKHEIYVIILQCNETERNVVQYN